jgi:hypothetical protein
LRLDLQSERFSPVGNVTGEGARRSLGTPMLDALHILVRETTQNAWDARCGDDAPVRLRFHLRELSLTQRTALEELLRERPPAGATRAQLAESLGRDRLRVLEVSDFGARGLGGPVRADADVVEGESHDFVEFLRNMGSARDRRLGGGTYGYGKSASYRLSRCATLLAHTRTSVDGRGTVRFIGASIGDHFQHQQRRHTGRHWWGTRAADGIVDPLVGDAADEAALSVGFVSRGAADTGTSLAILDPEIEPRSSVQAINAIAESLIWFFWPKMMLGPDGRHAMTFELALDGEAVPIPKLSSFPPVEAFVAAMGALKAGQGREVRCERPAQTLGSLAFARTPRRERVTLDTGNERELVPEFCSHVALMRPAELVVRYLPGPRLSTDRVEYGGVFICNEEVEPHFAAAEPPAHDDWVPDFLDGRARTFVRVALRRINEAMNEHAEPPNMAARNPEQQSLAALGDALGGVLVGQTGSRIGGGDPPAGAGRGSGSGAGTGTGAGAAAGGGAARPRGLKISQPAPFRFAGVRGIPCALFKVVVQSPRLRAVQLEASAVIVLEGGSMLEPGNGEGPQIVAWLAPNGNVISVGAAATVEVSDRVELLVAVSIRQDMAVAVNVEAVG